MPETRRSRGPRVDRRVAGGIVAAYLALSLAFAALGYLSEIGNGIDGEDSVFYYVYLPSLLMDGDLVFDDDLRAFHGSGHPIERTQIGRARNIFPIGTALFWSPFFALGHVLTLVARGFGATLLPDGTSTLYVACVYVGHSLYGLAGLLLTARFVRGFASPAATLAACLALLLTTPLTYYLWPLQAMSHTVGFALAALALVLWRERGIGLPLALVAGAMVLVRWMDLLMLAPIALASLADLWRARDAAERQHWVAVHAGVVGVVALCMLPQVAVWWSLNGVPYPTDVALAVPRPDRPVVDEVLFSTRHGLLTWHPAFALGALGLAFLWPRDRVLTAAFAGGLALLVLASSMIGDWWAGWAFGQRRFVSALPVFALGFALLFDALAERRALRLSAGALMLCLAVWNQLFVFQYWHGLIPRGGELDLKQLVWDKFELPSLRRARSEGRAAARAFLARDDEAFYRHAHAAYLANPDYPPTRPLYALACLRVADLQEAERVFASWLAAAPSDPLARWGFAASLARRGETQAAARALRDAPDTDQLPVDLVERAARGERTLFDDELRVRLWAAVVPPFFNVAKRGG